MIQTEDTEYSLPQPEIAGELLKISGARTENKGQFDGKWLDEKDPLQNAYVQANGQVINQILIITTPLPRVPSRS